LLGERTTTEEEGTTLEEITSIVRLPIERTIVEGKTPTVSLFIEEEASTTSLLVEEETLTTTLPMEGIGTK
jgi:hypothetical protein